MRIGRFELSLNPPEVAEDFVQYPRRLAELARILRGVTWILGGALCIPLARGSFYRRHYDVDILFPLEAFPQVEAAMKRGGYRLSTYFPMSFFGRCRFNLHVDIRATGPLARCRTRKLKFRDATGTRRAPHLLSVVEALPYRMAGNELHTCDGRFRVRLERPLVAQHYRTEDGGEIRCLDLAYVALFKGNHASEKDVIDHAIIRDLLRDSSASAAD